MYDRLDELESLRISRKFIGTTIQKTAGFENRFGPASLIPVSSVSIAVNGAVQSGTEMRYEPITPSCLEGGKAYSTHRYYCTVSTD